MKKALQILFVILTTGLTTVITSQNLSNNNVDIKLNEPIEKNTLKKVLENGKYYYSKSAEKVLVEIKGDAYIEYHPNNEFIKAKIKWDSNNCYRLIITEIKKPNLPFKKGIELKTEIIKVKGKKYSYRSELKNRKWTGKLIKVIKQ
jgi:hypothetical protein